jgi:CheY-like chemotaxis protein
VSDKAKSNRRKLLTRHQIYELEELSKLRILVAEDNIVNQKVVIRMLEKMGLRSDLAKDGQEAIDATKSRHYDLILMDVEMPKLDGLDATRSIRTQDGMADIPIVALTAHALIEEKEKCLNSGMNDFLAKPVSPKSLSDMITKWCSPPSPPQQ